MLTEALKLVGVYDKAAEGVQRMLNQAAMNQLIPVDNWAMFAEKGGIKGQVDWMPLDMVVAALTYLMQRKQTLSQEMFELLGISDIQRGMAQTKETATTQRLKAQFGSARGARGSEEVARFVTDNYRMRAEIICKHWQPQTIMYVSQIDKTPDKALAQQAVQLLKQRPERRHAGQDQRRQRDRARLGAGEGPAGRVPAPPSAASSKRRCRWCRQSPSPGRS